MITTPAVDNLVGRYLPRQCAHCTAPSHVSLFTTAAMRELLRRFWFRPVQFAIDRAVGAARTLGRRLHRTEGRSVGPPARAVSKPLSMTDRVIERLVRRPNHLYVIAEKLPRQP